MRVGLVVPLMCCNPKPGPGFSETGHTRQRKQRTAVFDGVPCDGFAVRFSDG